MLYIFRVDASLDIGSGHVMRCLALADRLKKKGAECQFICCTLAENLIAFIRFEGFRVFEIENHLFYTVINSEFTNADMADNLVKEAQVKDALSS